MKHQDYTNPSPAVYILIIDVLKRGKMAKKLREAMTEV
jgi:hypothetical protein